MAEGIADCMPLALRSVGDAIRHDSENRTKEAYCQYLSSMMYISQVLKDYAWDKDLRQVYNSDTAKLFRLLQQCQERALTIISTLASDASPALAPKAEKCTQHLQPPSAGIQRRYSESSVVDGNQSDQSHLPTQSRASHKLSDTATPGARLSAPSNDDYLHLPSPPGSPMPRHQRTGSYDPLETVYQENKHLIAAYRTRMQNSTQGRRNQDVISKNLSLMRRMSENLVIAKAREEAIKKKLLERQRRLQEETNKRFGPAVLYTREEQEQRLLYTKILEFEQETVWPKHLREKLKLMPTDAKLIKDIITKIFCSSDHPLTQFLFQYQYHVYRKLAPLVKDVGFKDVKSGHKATSKGTDITLSETQPDQKHTGTIDNAHGDADERENKEDNMGFLRETEGTGNLPSELNTDGSSRAAIKKDQYKEGKYNAVENDGEEYKSDKDVAKHVDSEGKSSSTDLQRLKSFLDEGAQAEGTSENEQVGDSIREQGSLPVEEKDESENLETYFEELEDDMFDWESNEEDDVRESNVIHETHEIKSKESICENKKASHAQIKVDGSDDRVKPTASSDEKSSTELDSLVKDEKENSSDKVNKDETHGPDEVLKKKEIESENVDADHSDQPTSNDSVLNANQCVSSKVNEDDTRGSRQTVPLEENETEPEDSDVDQSDQPKRNANASDANQYISSEEEQCTEVQTICSDVSDKAETIQTEPLTDDPILSNEEAPGAHNTAETPREEREDSLVIDNQADKQMPKLSLFEKSNGKNENDSVLSETFPQADEVRKQLKDILVDVRFFLEKLQKLLVLAYEPIDTPAGRDLCYSCVEFPFFKPLWPMLLAVLRQVNFEKEVCLADVMSANISKGPFDMGVPQRLCMVDQEVLDSMGNKYPYQMAVEELHKLVTMFCPLEKLECLVRTSRCICQCVEDYWESKGKPRHSPETAIGCDDLLPILSFVIIRSGMAQLVSECDAMEEFIPEGYLMGEEGYCLTTLVTALAYLATLKPT